MTTVNFLINFMIRILHVLVESRYSMFVSLEKNEGRNISVDINDAFLENKMITQICCIGLVYGV